MSSYPSAILALADGTIFHGKGIGVAGSAVGEVVFNTSMSGYQELLTDPGYARKILAFTYPQIGNTGVNAEDEESAGVHVAGLVLRDLPVQASNFRLQQTLESYLQQQQVVAIAGVDTRKLVRLLRDKGALAACICSAAPGEALNGEEAVARARSFAGSAGVDLASQLTTRETYSWTEGEWALGKGYGELENERFHVVVYDFGVKRSALRMLVARGCRLSVVPAGTSAAEVLALRPQGVFLSSGPGDPHAVEGAVQAIAELIAAKVPLFGIGLGHQLLALASGARCSKLSCGHHGASYPVKELGSGKVLITTQNHDYVVDATSLPANLRATHVALFDGSNQGLERTDAAAFSFQGDPGSGPGPRDVDGLFDRFVKLIEQSR